MPAFAAVAPSMKRFVTLQALWCFVILTAPVALLYSPGSVSAAPVQHSQDWPDSRQDSVQLARRVDENASPVPRTLEPGVEQAAAPTLQSTPSSSDTSGSAVTTSNNNPDASGAGNAFASASSMPTGPRSICAPGVLFGAGLGNSTPETAILSAGDKYMQAFVAPMGGTLCSVSIAVDLPLDETIQGGVLEVYGHNVPQIKILRGVVSPLVRLEASSQTGRMVFIFCQSGSPYVQFSKRFNLVFSQTSSTTAGPSRPIKIQLGDPGSKGVLFGPSFSGPTGQVTGSGLMINMTIIADRESSNVCRVLNQPLDDNAGIKSAADTSTASGIEPVRSFPTQAASVGVITATLASAATMTLAPMAATATIAATAATTATATATATATVTAVMTRTTRTAARVTTAEWTAKASRTTATAATTTRLALTMAATVTATKPAITTRRTTASRATVPTTTRPTSKPLPTRISITAAAASATPTAIVLTLTSPPAICTCTPSPTVQPKAAGTHQSKRESKTTNANRRDLTIDAAIIASTTSRLINDAAKNFNIDMSAAPPPIGVTALDRSISSKSAVSAGTQPQPQPQTGSDDNEDSNDPMDGGGSLTEKARRQLERLQRKLDRAVRNLARKQGLFCTCALRF
ncbi:hypothetical protein BC831DRAFT_448695 [Entophlyctis helioformis]|nr:hypothetical protein BC831DRAFT_448695 [Entophlyctis helioformis]